MVKVNEAWKLQENSIVLVCDMFEDDIITNKISTDIGEFEKPSFSVEAAKKCFSEPKTRDIVLHTKKDCANIRNIEFI